MSLFEFPRRPQGGNSSPTALGPLHMELQPSGATLIEDRGYGFGC
jgi:hypothetical protein